MEENLYASALTAVSVRVWTDLLLLPMRLCHSYQMEKQLNALGGELEICSLDPLTGFFRDGYANTGPEDLGSHTVCVVVSSEFLSHQKGVGNDLSTPVPEFGFPGLKPGDRWAVCAARWQEAIDDGVPTGIILAATNVAATHIASLSALKANSVDVPTDASSLL